MTAHYPTLRGGSVIIPSSTVTSRARHAEEHAVGCVNHPRVYDPALMVNIKAAFREVWTTLERDSIQALKVAVIQRLMGLAAQGFRRKNKDEVALCETCLTIFRRS